MTVAVKERFGKQATILIPDPSRLLNGPESFTLKDFDRELPDDSWEAVDLVGYAKHQVSLIQVLQRTMAVHVYRLGMALSLYRRHYLGHGDWQTFLKEQGLSGPTAWRAMQLAERADSEEKVAGLGITEAYLQYGILRTAAKDGGKEPPDDEEATEATTKTTGEAESYSQPEDQDYEPEEPDYEPEDQEDDLDEEEDDDDMPPAKESMSPLAALVQSEQLLAWVEERVQDDDWDQEQSAACRQRLKAISGAVQRIRKALS
ncbi:MAG: hypothetical protein RBS80_18670 [Thermoguttaceae bacterium]|nr:hypothetical protein [Thermoguttaceae bacterium]